MAEARRIAGRDAAVEAVAVLSYDDPVCTNDKRTLRQHHLSLEGGDFLAFVGDHAVGFDIDGLFEIGSLGKSRSRCQRPRSRETQGRGSARPISWPAHRRWP